MSVFIFLRNRQIVAIGDTTIPYPAFLVFSIAVWNLFSGGVKYCSEALDQNAQIGRAHV